MTRWRIIPRSEKSRKTAAYFSPFLAIAVSFAVGGGLLASLGYSPLDACRVFFVAPLSSFYNAVEVLNKTVTLAVIALGLSIGFRANVWNIGAEGQFTAGAIGASAVALWLIESRGGYVLAMMCFAGAAGGMAWAALPAWLRTRFGASEILSSLMLVYIAQQLLGYLVHGPMRDPEGFNFPQSRLFADSALIPVWAESARLYASVLLLPLTAAAAHILIVRSFIGFQWRVVGEAPRAARYAGYSEKRAVWASFLIAGGCAGIMGAVEVAGPIGQLTPVISPGYGFTAIIVAFLGRLNPVGIVLAAAIMALIYIGGETAQISLGLPKSISGAFQGLVLFCLLAAEFTVRYQIRRVSEIEKHAV